MTAAFEVGVSLALQGGVSAEMAKTRKELAQLGAALVSRGISVRHLRQIAQAAGTRPKIAPEGGGRPVDHLSSVFHEPSAREWAQPRQPKQHVAVVREGASGKQPMMLDQGIDRKPSRMKFTGEDGRKPSQRVISGVVVPPRSEGMRSVRADEPATNTAGGTGLLGTPKFRLGSTPATKQFPQPSARQTSSVAPRVGASLHLGPPMASAPLTIAYGASGTPAWKAQLSPYIGSQSRPFSSGLDQYRATASSYTGRPDVPFAPRLPPRGKPRVPDATGYGAAQSRTQSGNVGSNSDNPVMEPQSLGMARPDGAGGERIQGDVYLDGASIGRWMSRVLSREAERASVGPTGFDTRRGRLMPGATVSG